MNARTLTYAHHLALRIALAVAMATLAAVAASRILR